MKHILHTIIVSTTLVAGSVSLVACKKAEEPTTTSAPHASSEPVASTVATANASDVKATTVKESHKTH